MTWTLKDENDRKVVDGVLDLATVKTIYRLQEKGIIGHLIGATKEGKESKIIIAFDASGKKKVIVKIYKIDASQFQKMQKYIVGDKRFSGVKMTRRSLVFNWCKKEFSNLKRARGAGVNAPEPLGFLNNVLVMEYIADDEGGLAPPLKKADFSDSSVMIDMILSEMRKLYVGAELVHADLSEYNIMVRDGKPVIHDLAQSVHKSHPLAAEFLIRDVENVLRYFSGIGVVRDKGGVISYITREENEATNK